MRMVCCKTKIMRKYILVFLMVAIVVSSVNLVGINLITAKAVQLSKESSVAKPKILSVSQINAKTLVIKWSKVKKVSGYVLYCKKDGNSYKKIKIMGKNKKSYKHRKLKKGITYSYKIKAYKNINGKKYFSNYSNVGQESIVSHEYKPATCFAPEICKDCGKIKGEPLGHQYDNNSCVRCGKVDPDTLPVGLEKLFVIDSSEYKYKSGTFTDSFGNTYNGVHYFTDLYESGNNREPHAMFNLENKYRTFKGTIVASTKTGAEWTYYINIYVDDVLKFSKSGFSKTSGSVDFNVDLSNGEKLKIAMGLEGHSGDWNQEIGIVNAVLTK